ncbi:hypothetical protein A3770_15p76030 [Chloropicon primus]|uniref:F-box domain-containing protein n=2 Tax=Chloropicon primus TaxID=1764295 RepID=A0A5B8MZG3_9CHLO|nr:hypothetical protein A3770_15p76030 [Chloropicon primus]|eukprot:QDZ25085.1 hypothetical protein A3770_15p76030 [Chloropicon primus]
MNERTTREAELELEAELERAFDDVHSSEEDARGPAATRKDEDRGKRKRKRERERERETRQNLDLVPEKRRTRGRDGEGVTDASGASSLASSSPSGLADLPSCVLLRVFLYLSAKDLVSCSLVNRLLGKVACEDLLWKRLHDFRWPNRGGGVLSGDEMMLDGEPNAWKNIYFERAKSDIGHSQAGCDDFMKEHIQQMHLHLLDSCPDREAFGNSTGLDVAGGRGAGSECDYVGGSRKPRRQSTMSELIERFRRDNPATITATDHHCDGKTCEMVELRRDSRVYICQCSGKVHVCGERCESYVVDSNDGSKVCKITGWVIGVSETADTTPAEEMGWREDEVDAQCVEDVDAPAFGKGRLGRAYERGYYMNEEELYV